MAKKFPEYQGLNLSDINKTVLAEWAENDTFHRSIDTREGAPSFVFYEGPPSANGMPGIHHVMARTIKDVFCRFKTMQGFQVKRKAGWDTHGLPVELGVEKMLGITKEDIGKKISVDEYNAACRREVMKYTREWENLTNMMGYWVDMEHPYITYDNKYIETLWYLLKKLYDKGLLYKGYTIQPYSPAAGTGLSSHELNQPGCYKDVKDLTAIAMFEIPLWRPCLGSDTPAERNYDHLLRICPNALDGKAHLYFLAWTTTPWTLPSNTALCVGANIGYALVKTQNPYTKEEVNLILAEVLVPNVLAKQEYEILQTFKGSELAGLEYEQLIPFVKPLNANSTVGNNNTTRTKDTVNKLFETIKSYNYLGEKQLQNGTLLIGKAPHIAPQAYLHYIFKPLSEIEITETEQKLKQNIPDDYKEFLRISNGLEIFNTISLYGKRTNYSRSIEEIQPFDLDIPNTYEKPKNADNIFIIGSYDDNYLYIDKNDNSVHLCERENAKSLYKWNSFSEMLLSETDRLVNYFDENGKEIDSSKSVLPTISQPAPQPNAFRVICGDFVTTEDGTGIVHIAPTFGADDDRVAKQNGIVPMLLLDKNGKQVPMVDLTGKFYNINDLDAEFVTSNVNVDLYKNFAEKYVKDDYYAEIPENHLSLDTEICLWLQEKSLLFKKEKHTHNYPHCWRTDKPVLYYPLDSWFIKTTAVKDEMIELNNTINWKPQSTGTGRFGKWLENLNDWNLSRSRYWGTPLPIWRTEDGTEETCIGSVAELFAEIEKSVAVGFMQENPYKNFKVGDYSTENYVPENIDLHRPYVDNIILVSKSGKPMKRELDLIDVWFDSGAMPFAQVHYPFENTDLVKSGANYPADFISEGVDQTRGWFFTLHAISTMVKGSVAFKNVISNGLVLDKNGNKMSKRLGNAVDPFSTIEKYGSDPLRWYMMTNAAPWDNLKFDIEGVEEVRRKFFGTLYNTYSFFALYANVDGFSPETKQIPVSERPEIDRWVISLLNTLIKDVTAHYEDYEPTRAGRAIQDFVTENLSNWYVRLNRKRFWGGAYDTDKIAAYQTLYLCLLTVAKLMSPIAPFYADRLYKDLTVETDNYPSLPKSVHLTDFPKTDISLIDTRLEQCMDLAQKTSSMILALRKKGEKKVRQPLQKAIVPAADENTQKQILYVTDLIRSEVNIKELQVLAPDVEMENIVKKIKPNFKTLGKKYGKFMKEIAAVFADLNKKTISEIEKSEKYVLTLPSGENIELENADYEIFTEDMPGWLVANDGKLTVALDITVTPELEREGIARELVNRIQNLRKTSGFEITDRVNVQFQQNEKIDGVIAEFGAYIAAQVLADKVESVVAPTDAVELDMEEYKIFLSLRKI